MWEQIRSNRRKSVVLLVSIGALLIVLGFAIGEAVAPGLGVGGVAVAGIVWSVMALSAYFQGKNILLSLGGARRIAKSDHPQLYNVVEEMCIAAGLPKVPEIHIIDDLSLNAFAAGRNPNDSAVAVTAGLLGKLNRDQLQGVMAHEISHIINRDVLFMTLISVTAGAVVALSDIFWRGMRHGTSSRFGGNRRGGGQGAAIMLLVAIVLAILAPIAAQIIQMAASRRREYLADANAAVLTRYPEGLASALEVIAYDFQPRAQVSRVTAPMYIHNPLQAAGESGWFSTHPPIQERVRILRAMGGVPSGAAYQRAWEQVSGRDAGRLPASALTLDGGTARAAAEGEAGSSRRSLRDAGDALRTAGGFTVFPCECGAKLKIPPEYHGRPFKCPRCGAAHQS